MTAQDAAEALVGCAGPSCAARTSGSSRLDVSGIARSTARARRLVTGSARDARRLSGRAEPLVECRRPGRRRCPAPGPRSACCRCPETTMPVPLMTIWIRNRPSTVPRIEPTPPERLHTADDRRGDRVQLIRDAEPAVGLAAAAGEEDAPEGREHPREAVGDRLQPAGRQAAEPGGRLVAPQGVEVAAQHRRPHHHARRDGDQRGRSPSSTRGCCPRIRNAS